jgi:hypothetical protein
MLQSDRNYCARIDVALYAHRGQWVSLPRGAWQCISNCPSCKVLYHLIKAEAGPETTDRDINCGACGAPFPGREESFVPQVLSVRGNRCVLIHLCVEALSGAKQQRPTSLRRLSLRDLTNARTHNYRAESPSL